jgi:hypothetical protein
MGLGRLASAAVLGCIAVAGCGGDDASEVAARAGQSLREVSSGRLDVGLDLRPLAGGAASGFDLSGPFALSDRGLPRAALRYTERAGGRRASAGIVTDGRKGFACVSGRRVALSGIQLAQLRGVGRVLGEPGKQGPGLRFDRWLSAPTLGDGPRLGGVRTQRVRGELDVVALLNDLLALGSAHPAQIEGREAERLEKASRGSLELVAGEDDHLLRRLALDLSLRVPAELRRLTPVPGGRLSVRMRLDQPNRPVETTAALAGC